MYSVQGGYGSQGPLMAQLLRAQEADDDLCAHAELRRAALALAAFAGRLGAPSLVGVSPGGHRLVGAAVALDDRVRGRASSELASRASYLLVEGAAVSAIALERERHWLDVAGAGSVFAFAASLPLACTVSARFADVLILRRLEPASTSAESACGGFADSSRVLTVG
jgi:hypothetical protein